MLAAARTRERQRCVTERYDQQRIPTNSGSQSTLGDEEVPVTTSFPAPDQAENWRARFVKLAPREILTVRS